MSRWKTRLRSLLCGAYRYSGAMPLHEAMARAAGRQFMTVLLFHRVTDAIPEDGLTVSPARFRQICRLLAGSFNVVPVGEVFRLARAGGPLPPRTVAVTFDDCYRGNLAAARVLGEHGLPACFFLPTGYIGTDHVFDWDRGLKNMPNLTWEDVHELVRMGHEIGSHTVTHANLGTVPIEEARHEIADSKAELEER